MIGDTPGSQLNGLKGFFNINSVFRGFEGLSLVPQGLFASRKAHNSATVRVGRVWIWIFTLEKGFNSFPQVSDRGFALAEGDIVQGALVA